MTPYTALLFSGHYSGLLVSAPIDTCIARLEQPGTSNNGLKYKKVRYKLL